LLVDGRLLPARLSIFRCGACALSFFEEAPADDYWAVSGQNEIYRDGGVAEERRAFFEWVLGQISGFARPGWLLDVGSGRGDFAQLATEHGWRVSVVEPSITATRGLEAKGIERVFNRTFEQYDDPGDYDCITLLDILEHTRDPKAVIEKAASMLSPGGILVALTPDGASPLRRVIRDLARVSERLSGLLKYQYYLPHISYLGEGTFRRYADQSGLRVLRVRRTTTPRQFLKNKLRVHYDKYGGGRLIRGAVAATYPLTSALLPNKLFLVARKVA
jgi:SAM-dependent methyltransferase